MNRFVPAVALSGALLAIPLLTPNPYLLGVGVQILLFSVAAQGAWLLLNGGLWSFGQGAVALVGAYVAAILVMRLGFSFWIALPVAALAGGLVSAVVAIPLLRTSGVTFAILTMVGLLAVDQVIALASDITGGRGGMVGVPPPEPLTIGDMTLTFSEPRAEYYIAAALFILSFLAVIWAVGTPWFRTLSAIRQQPLLARSIGVSPRRVLMVAFVFAGVTTAAVGAYSAPYYGVAHPKLWYVYPSIFIIAYAIVGGVRSPYGPLLGATALIVATELTRSAVSLQLILVAAGMVIATLALPNGIAGLPSTIAGLTRRSRAGPERRAVAYEADASPIESSGPMAREHEE